MTLAWTTVLVIVFLLPGVAFLTGLAAPERHAREVVRTTAIGDVGVAVFAAILLHGVLMAVLIAIGFNPRSLARAVTLFEDGPTTIMRAEVALRWLPRLALYVMLTALIGFGLGSLVARLIVLGPLRFAATHRWVYDVLKFGAGDKGIVTAHVLSTTVENGRALMYKGRLSEFFLNSDGHIAYLVLKNCRRFYMSFETDVPLTTRDMSIFDGAVRSEATREWNYLLIQGNSIANVLFDKSKTIEATPSGEAALGRALDEMRRDRGA